MAIEVAPTNALDRGAGVAGADLVAALVSPGCVAVVGASADPGKVSGRALSYLRSYGFAGEVVVVNPHHDSIAGYPCVASVAHIPPGRVDAAIVNVPAALVTSVLSGLDEVGVRAAVVIGSGFEAAESVPRKELLEFLEQPARRLRVIGPNCVGTMSVASGAHLNFSSVLQERPPRGGGVALVTQSGATGNGILMSLLRRGVGLAHWFSTGDELDVGALEVISGLLDRDEVGAVGLFLEAVTDIAWLPTVRDAIARTGKPVFAVKVADSDLGQLAAGGHTGRVVGAHDISRAVLSQTGFRLVGTVAELTDALVASEVIGALGDHTRITAVSISGASAVIVADTVQASPTLELPPLPAALAGSLGDFLGHRVPVGNPLDVPFLGETETFAGVVDRLAAAPGSDVVVVVESSLAHDRPILVEALTGRSGDSSPIALTHLSEDDPMTEADLVRLAAARVAVFPTPERAVRALSRLAPVGADSSTRVGHDDGPGSDGVAVGLDEVAALLPPDFAWAAWSEAADLAQAQEVAARYGFPVVVKAAGRTIVHRTELGAVARAADGPELVAAYGRVSAVCRSHGDGVIVQRVVPAGQEVLLAVLRDPEYGMVALLRPGGIFAELLDEQVVLWHGWDAATRWQTLRNSRLGRLLGPYRGKPAGDLEGLHRLVETALDAFGDSRARFVEFNPIIVSTNAAYAVDAIATLSPNGEPHGT